MRQPLQRFRAHVSRGLGQASVTGAVPHACSAAGKVRFETWGLGAPGCAPAAFLCTRIRSEGWPRNLDRVTVKPLEVDLQHRPRPPHTTPTGSCGFLAEVTLKGPKALPSSA